NIFGTDAFFLRLPNLLFFPVYAYFLYKLGKRLHSRRVRMTLWATGLFMHGFVEYFAYSRGYGISMALLSGALYFSFCFFRENSVRRLPAALMLYWLATVGNLTLLNSMPLFVALATVYLFRGTF